MFVWLSIYLEIRLAYRDFHFFFLCTFDYYQKNPKIIPWKCSFQTAVCNFVSNSIQLHFDFFFFSFSLSFLATHTIHLFTKTDAVNYNAHCNGLDDIFFENILQIYGETNEFYDFFGVFNCFSATWQLICHQNTHFNGLDCPSPPQIYISPFVFTRGFAHNFSIIHNIIQFFFIAVHNQNMLRFFSIRKTHSISIYWNLLEIYLKSTITIVNVCLHRLYMNFLSHALFM